MALMSTPPWLNVTPQTFLGAMEAGTSAGLRERAQESSESEAADRLRLAYDSLAAHERMQNKTANAKLAQNQAAMDLRRQQMEGLQDYRNQRLGQFDTEEDRRQSAANALNEYRDARLGQIDRAQDISEEKADNMVNRGEAKVVTFPELPGVKFVQNPSGAVFKVGSAPRGPNVQLEASGKPKGYSGPLSDPTIQSLMGTNAPAALAPPAPEQPKMLPPTADNPNALRLGTSAGNLAIGNPSGGGLSPSLEASGPLPMPKTKDDLVKGQVYQTARGPAVWDGENFTAQ